MTADIEPQNRNLQGLGIFKKQSARPKKGECQYDCNRDRDCVDGLVCAQRHRLQLIVAGLSWKKAYCTGDVGNPGKSVCFNATTAGI
jgi:hypothetical protein